MADCNSDLAGKTITAARPMAPHELNDEMWDAAIPPVVLELDDGSILYPACDAEGNAPGCLFGRTAEGEPMRHQIVEVDDDAAEHMRHTSYYGGPQ